MSYCISPSPSDLVSLSMTISRPIDVCAGGVISFFVMASNIACMCNMYVMLCMCHSFRILSPVGVCLSCLHDFAVVNSVAVRNGVHVPSWVMCFSRYMPRSGISGPCASAKLLQSCLTVCDPRNCSPPAYSVHGIFQARILEWVAISFLQGVTAIVLFLVF